MREIGFSDVVNLLDALGIYRGDGLLVHSAIQYLGRPIGGVAMYYQAFNHILHLDLNDRITDVSSRDDTGSSNLQGTLAVPAFNFSFARGEPYDPKVTPCEGMGAFSEYVRQHPQALRTPHPMQSLAVIGRWAEDLSGRDTPSAFAPGSAFERMLELDFRLLLLGADIQAVSMVHYSEQRAAVPYRYWKDFTGKIRRRPDDSGYPIHQNLHDAKNATAVKPAPDEAGCWEEKTYRMFVRNLELDPQLDLSPIQDECVKRGLWLSIPVNYGLVSSCKLLDFVAVTDELLKSNPLCLVSKSGPEITSDDIRNA